MKDEEILRRLAAIEGCHDLRRWSPPGGNHEFSQWYRRTALGNESEVWNPLTNKAQAFELVEKYNMTICPEFTCSPEEPHAEYSGRVGGGVAVGQTP